MGTILEISERSIAKEVLEDMSSLDSQKILERLGGIKAAITLNHQNQQ
jgi:hypothetical protein